ncbi:MAG: Tetraacyldisaccharide 4'-kinase [Chlamydiia bacterium]|nr:Tetraacyldisaccharide 4'-kinase [Chlamydiia bacterium]MCH9616151.1 Tetraacyldisaccharide 4'-kinase [Chlamydiia bacterium]MCH9629863.1 Tetraacyldisaccharide 4'-kinase [Chlamydiia bacterium]
MYNTLEIAAQRLIEGNSPLKGVLTFLSLFFRLGVNVKNLAYDSGALKPKKVNTRVISVGNIVAGGTGKTPFVMLLARKLRSVTILSRGYRTNDEPKLMAKKLPECEILVNKDRVKSATKAKNIAILDDGMQYRQLHRDLEIVLINSKNPFGHGHFLPRGYLRDTPKRLNVADLIVLNHIHTDEEFEAAKKQLSPYTSAPCIGTCYATENIFKGENVAVFCALGNPKGFIDTVKRSGANVQETLILPDHVAFTEKLIKNYLKKCQQKDIQTLVCSEKDAVKLPTRLLETYPIHVLKGELTITHGEEHLNTLLKEIT